MKDWGQTEATTEEAEKTIIRVIKLSIPAESKRADSKSKMAEITPEHTGREQKMLEPADEGS